MRTCLKSVFGSLARNDVGATLVEYGIAISLAVAVGTVGMAALGGAIQANVAEAEAQFD